MGQCMSAVNTIQTLTTAQVRERLTLKERKKEYALGRGLRKPAGLGGPHRLTLQQAGKP